MRGFFFQNERRRWGKKERREQKKSQGRSCMFAFEKKKKKERNEPTNCLLISDECLFIDGDRGARRGQVGDRWRKIRGKVALIFHLSQQPTGAPPPTHGAPTRAHTHRSVLESIFDSAWDMKKFPNYTFSLSLFPPF